MWPKPLSNLLKIKNISSSENSLKSKFFFSPSTKSYFVIAPEFYKSKNLNASGKLKSEFSAISILAASMSLSMKIIDFKLFVSSISSTLSNLVYF